MPQINSGKSPPWVAGEIVTAAELNQMIDAATLDPSAVTSQSNLTTLTGDEYSLVVDTAGLLKKTQVKNTLSTGNDIVVGNILNPIGGVTIAPFTEVRLNAPNIRLQNNATVGSNIDLITHSGIQLSTSNLGIGFNAPNGDTTFLSRTLFSYNSAVKLPTGSTAQRPASPVVGDIRFNSTTSKLEFYNGSTWDSVVTSTNIASGTYGLYEIFVQNFQSSTNITNVSSSFSKPSNEIWEFEVDYYPTYDSGDYTYIYKAGGSVWWFTRFNGLGRPAMLTAKWVIQAGTVLTSETVTFDSQVGGGSPKHLNREFRIYKYKPIAV